MSKERNIKILPMKIGDFFYEADFETIENTLEAKQKYVGGIIECLCIDAENKLDIILHEEGKLIGLPINRAWIWDGEVVDLIVGKAFICRHDDEGNFCSIREEDKEIVNTILKPVLNIGNNKVFVTNNDGTVDILDMLCWE